jgi:small neutral amino acid transporter SnatA (MarC family)
MNIPILWNFVITSFALMNPLGMVPIFLTLTAGERKDVQRLVALFVVITVLALLLLVGPGVIANVILYANEIESMKQDLLNFELVGGTLLLSLRPVDLLDPNICAAELVSM